MAKGEKSEKATGKGSPNGKSYSPNGKGYSPNGKSGKAAGKGKSKGKGKASGREGEGGADIVNGVIVVGGIHIPKEVIEAVKQVCEKTLLRVTDLDPKAYQYLKFVHENARLDEMREYMELSIEKVSSREKVINWPPYVFTLLRKFDGELYKAFQEGRGVPKSSERKAERAERKKKDNFQFSTTMRTEAVEFCPGKEWSSDLPELKAAPAEASASETAKADGAPAPAETAAA